MKGGGKDRPFHDCQGMLVGTHTETENRDTKRGEMGMEQGDQIGRIFAELAMVYL
jgi:hypothetical protein